jgi:CheY-like chemotaxis protein
MAVELLQMLLPDEHESLLAALRSSAERGAEMVKQILSFARGVEGQHIDLQLKHIIHDVEKMLRYTLPKSIEVHAYVPNELWVISGDATQLSQVLMNLCVNGRDAMPQGGRLMLRAENKTFDESYALMHPQAKPGPYVLLQVTDTGTGIAPDILDKVFDPFFTTKELGKGTGLGLSTTLGIVRTHGGFITVDSAVGKGTAFSVYLPAIETVRTKQADDEAPRQMPCGRGELVLVADDEASIREITKATLEAHGYRVLIAGDGIEAVALYAKHGQEIQVVLTDMQMPVFDGLATAKALHKLDPLVQIIAVSGVAASGEAAERAGWGVRAFLPKPYTAESLLITLQKLLQQGPANNGEGKGEAWDERGGERLTAGAGTG